MKLLDGAILAAVVAWAGACAVGPQSVESASEEQRDELLESLACTALDPRANTSLPYVREGSPCPRPGS